MIEIKNIQGSVIYSTELNRGAKRKFTLMKEDYVTLPFSLEEPKSFPIGSYAEIDGTRFEIVDLQKPTLNNSTGGYDYQLRLDAYYWKWKNKIFKFTPEVGGQEASWSLTASLDVHLGIFLRNLTALGYTYRGVGFEFSIDATVENKAIAMTYENTNMIDALSALAESFGCEWWVTDNVIHFGRCEYGKPVDFIVGENVEEMSRSESQSSYATRLYVFGSTRNIPSSYRPVDESIVINGVVQRRLMLPEGIPYIDAYEGMSEEEAIEEVIIFDDVYPKTDGHISSVETYDDTTENEDGTTTTETFYRFTDNGITFSQDYILEGEELRVQFTSGSLNGMEFGVAFNPKGESEKNDDGSWNSAAQLFEVVANEDYGRKLPDSTLNPKVEDTYILIGWDSTKIGDLGLVSKAEEELYQKGLEVSAKRKVDPSTYNCKMMSDYMFGLDSEGNQDELYRKTFEVGDKVNLVNDAYFSNGRVSRIIGYEYNLDYPFDSPVYVVGETASYSRIGELESRLDSLILNGMKYVGGSGSGVYIIGTNDTTKPTNRNVYSALRSDQRFLRKDKDDTAKGKITFNKGWETKEFISGLLGHGAKVDEYGQAELESLFIRTFIEVPELRFNRYTVRMGDEINSVSAGVVESVTPDMDADGNVLTSGTLTLKLEDTDIGTLEYDDIVTQIYSDLLNKDNNSSETTDDGKGNRHMKGFATVMFKVLEVSGERNEIIRYSLRPLSDNWKKQVHPYQFGAFSQRGNFSNKDRQIIIYKGLCPKPYTRYMDGVNDWEFTAKMIGMQLGYLGNLSVFGMDMTGYSAYLNNVYFTGMIRQLYIPEWIEGESAAQNGTLVYMGGDHYVSKGNTVNPPLFDLTDENGNSLIFTDEDGEGNLIDLNNEEYDMLAKKGDDGVGIKSNVSYYMITDTTLKPLESSGEWSTSMIQPTELKPYLWKKTVVTYTNLTSQTTIECISVRGKDGTSVSIKGSFDSEAELKAAFPNGPTNASDAYIVGGDLYVWTGSEWKNVGAIKGEKGDTAYIHLKYANETSSGTQVTVGGSVFTLSFTPNDGEDIGDWLGIYTDFAPEDSMSISDYKWKKIRGDKGIDSTSYSMESPIGVINFTSDGYPNPASFVVSVKKQTGNGNMEACSDFYLATWRNDGTWQLVSVSSVKTSSVTIIPAATTVYKHYRVTAHSTTSVSESNIIFGKSIGVAFDGMKGTDGKDGKDGENGKDGEDGIFVYDCGLYDKNRPYYYKTIDGKVRRDKMVYEIGGSFYNFLVRSRQLDDSTGLVNTPPTKAAGDENWEVMSQFQSIIANTLFGTNANIGGFMVSAEKMLSQTSVTDSEGTTYPAFELNGSKGTMTMRQGEGTTWEVDKNGIQKVGNAQGERIEVNPNTKSISVFDAGNIERTVLDGKEYSRSELVATSGGLFTLTSNKSATATSQGSQYASVTSFASDMLYSSYAGLAVVDITSMQVTLSVPSTYAEDTEDIQGLSLGEAYMYVYTYASSEIGAAIIGKKLVAMCDIADQAPDGSSTSEVLKGTYTAAVTKGYHRIVVEVSVTNRTNKDYVSATGSWNIASAIISVESYMSRIFANGVMFSESSANYFMALMESGNMTAEVASNGNVFSIKDGALTVNGIRQPIVVYAARISDTSTSSSVSPGKTEIINNGTAATLVKTTTTGEYTLTLPSSYGLTSSNMIVNLTGYGTIAGGDNPIKATLTGILGSASSMRLTVRTSDDESANYGGFYIEIKKMI